ncbi:hypothetical protein [Rugamonas sp. DEMB1]|uniref:hypothetical protein n=1 Tax=Rugamonas sp. DEMB1 TaxID=3039386 RepID=UPI00244A08E3|nr:hypothetical protein [Rugamonas sp. DEMB1]WGG52019.1 hypothetical protein QC826_07470 [Rugamonas sp. DEMB1]
MHFTNFSASELKDINQKTMERMRVQKTQRSTTTAAVDAADAVDDIFANSKHAKFSRSDIRNALIAAMKKLREQQ